MLLEIQIHDDLIQRSDPAVAEAFPRLFGDALQAAFVKNAFAATTVIGVLAGRIVDADDLSPVDRDGALTVRHDDHRAVADDLVVALGIRGSLACFFDAARRENVKGHTVAGVDLQPLIRRHAADRTGSRFDDSHMIPQTESYSIGASNARPYNPSIISSVSCATHICRGSTG